MKTKRWKVTIPLLVVAVLVVWYVFRPERLMVNHSVYDKFPVAKGASDVQTLASGMFHSVLHPTSGTATIYRLGNGMRILRLTNFRTSNGPEVNIYMVAEEDAKDSASVLRVGFIDLGSMKGNIGDQNYALGPDVDLSKYRTVSVWCKRFAVNFGAAPLTPDHSLSRK